MTKMEIQTSVVRGLIRIEKPEWLEIEATKPGEVCVSWNDGTDHLLRIKVPE